MLTEENPSDNYSYSRRNEADVIKPHFFKNLFSWGGAFEFVITASKSRIILQYLEITVDFSTITSLQSAFCLEGDYRFSFSLSRMFLRNLK